MTITEDIGVAPIRISELQPSDESRWDTFVETSGGTFFHLSGWRRIIENTLRHPTTYLLCERDGEIVGILPLAQVKSWLFGNSLISLPFLVYGGPVTIDACAEQLLVDAARDQAERVGAGYLELRYQSPSGNDRNIRSTHATFKKALDPDPETNLKAIPRKQRAMVRKGQKAGLQSEVDDDVDRLFEALLACKRNLGTPFFDVNYLRAVKAEFGDQAEIMTIVKDKQVVCSVMSFRYKDEILPYYGGGGDLARDLKGNDFMYWAVMEKACIDGVKVFDFGRSQIDSGAYRFKKHWGFEPSPLAYERLPVRNSRLPNLTPTNPKYRLLVNLWKRLPLPIAGLLGPPLARRLG